MVQDNSIQNFSPITKDTSWLERKLKRTTYKTRYLFVGKPLLWMTCFFGSLGDALFGYDQGTIHVPDEQNTRLVTMMSRYRFWVASESHLCDSVLLRTWWRRGQR